MKKIILALALLFVPDLAWAQCNGVFPANTLCGNLSGSPAVPSAFSASGTVVGPGSSTVDDISTFANTGGTQVKDSGVPIAGVDGNVLNARTANYSLATTDCGKTITLGGNALFTLTAGAASGFAATCSVVVQNIDGFASGRAKILAINGVTFNNGNLLYPGQSFALKNENNTWVVTYAPGRWIWSASRSIFVDFASGSDSSDGLATGAGAYKNLSTAALALCNNMDVQRNQPTLSLADSASYVGFQPCDVIGATNNNSSNIVTVQGNTTTPANVVVTGSGANSAIITVNLHTPWLFAGMTLASASGPVVNVDINSLIYLGDKLVFSASGAQNAIQVGYDGKLEAQCPSGCAWTVNTASSLFFIATHGQFLTNGALTITLNSSPAFAGGVFNLSGSAAVTYSNNITWSGSVSGTTPAYIVASNAILNSSGGASSIPSNGSLSTVNIGGFVDTPTAPAVSSCGTSPSVRSGSTDYDGEITVGTATPTACTLTFAYKHTAMFCVVSSQSQLASFAYTLSATTIVTAQTATNSNKWNWHCYGT